MRLRKPRPPTYEQLTQMYQRAAADCDLARMAMQAVLHERPAAKTTRGHKSNGDGRYRYRVYRPDAPSGGILILTYEKDGQAPYSCPYWWEKWNGTESWVFSQAELDARQGLRAQLRALDQATATLGFDEGAECEHAAAELGEDGEL